MQQSSHRRPSLVGMLIRPRAQWQRLRERFPILLPLLIVCALASIGGLLTAQLIFERSIHIPIYVPDAEIDLYVTMFRVLVVVAATLFPVLLTGIMTLFHYGMARIVLSEATFRQLFSFNVHCVFILVVGFVVHSGGRFLFGENVAALDYEQWWTAVHWLLYLLGADMGLSWTNVGTWIVTGGLSQVMLQSIDLFWMWYFIVVAVGFSKVAEASLKSSIPIILVMFVVHVVLNAIGFVIV